MSFLLLSIILSSIIGIIIIAWIRSFDIYEKETFNAMLLAFFVGGTSSVVIAIGIYQFLELFGIDNNAISTATGSFLIIGPVEEFAKLIGLIIVYSLIRKQFNELTDGIIYMSCVALGFSIIENFFYANAGESSQYLLVYRAFISTPAHISFSVLIGYSWYRHKREGKSLLMVILALFIASLLHGIFDALAFSPYFNFLLLAYLYLIMHQTLRLVQYTNIISPFRPGFTSLFDDPSGETVADLECPYCQSSAPKALYRNSYFTALRCNNCGHYIVSVRDLSSIFRVFAPEYKRFRRKIIPARLDNSRILPSVYGAAFIDETWKLGFFRVDDIAERLQAINNALLKRFRKRSLFSGSMIRKFFE